jgi:hypothetical protein
MKDKYAEGVRSGWSIDKARWIVAPEKDRAHDVLREMPSVIAFAKEQTDKMRLLLQYNPVYAKVFWKEIHHRRQRDQEVGKGDFSESNIVYKYMENAGLLPAIHAL